jgi:hypothetical protein
MRRWLAVLLAGVLLVSLGCGGDKDRNINTGRDRPKATQPGD